MTRWRWDDTSQIARFPLESKVKMLDKGTSGRVAPAQSAVTPEYKEK